ncbi:hypothetical protein HU200_029436 [Digitaria exilis]|uniref:Uncharacterized protein n=1 Tax=Digitaria exilis TaxID=1010633 RepID=A0A835ES69_9POAL|nr:hypothetical protein HU200_029436 [Digitaria exilis]
MDVAVDSITWPTQVPPDWHVEIGRSSTMAGFIVLLGLLLRHARKILLLLRRWCRPSLTLAQFVAPGGETKHGMGVFSREPPSHGGEVTQVVAAVDGIVPAYEQRDTLRIEGSSAVECLVCLSEV